MTGKDLLKTTNNLPINPTQIICEITNVFRESLKTAEEIAEINAKKEVLIEDIKQRYATYNNAFAYIFSEREKVIAKHFEVIDKGIKENNDALIISGLNELSKFAMSSPFMQLGDFKKQLESGEPFEL